VWKRLHFTYPSPRALSDIVKLPLLALEPREKIVQVWNERHLGDEARVSTILDSSTYDRLLANGSSFPRFIIPVYEHDHSFRMLVLEWQSRHCLLTGLEQFRQSGTSAFPVLVATFYEDFKKSKGLVLGRLDITDPIVKHAQARQVFELLLEFYTHEDKLAWIKTFNRDPSKFSIQDYLKLTKRL